MGLPFQGLWGHCFVADALQGTHRTEKSSNTDPQSCAGRALIGLLMLAATFMQPLFAAAADCAGHSQAQCDIVEKIEQMRAGAATIRTENGKRNFVQDDFLIFEISTEREQGYLSIVYVSANDDVSFLSRDSGPVPAGTVLNIGDGKQSGGSLFVSPPFGGELALLFVSPTPIFSAEAPATANELLNALDRVGSSVVASYVLLETKPGV